MLYKLEDTRQQLELLMENNTAVTYLTCEVSCPSHL